MRTEREIALALLMRAEKEETLSFDAMLAKALSNLDDEAEFHRSFLTRLAQGTYRFLPRLDYVIDSYASTPAKRMKPLIRNLLRMSVYQILFLTDVPDASDCDEAVKLAVKHGFRELKGFVNGILRTIVREKEHIAYPAPEDESYMRVMYAMPDDVVQHFITHYGREAAMGMCMSLLLPKPFCIRLRNARMEADGVTKEILFAKMKEQRPALETEEHCFFEDSFLILHGGNPATLYGFAEGYFTVQDAASTLAVVLSGVKEGDTVIDVCASPGGKAACAYDLMHGKGCVIARDVSETKVAKMQETFTRLQIDDISCAVHDARVADALLNETADVLLCDVPCSALGIIGKKPEVKYRTSKEARASLARLQREIIDNVWRYVKEGGILLYSTCTINPKENEEQVEWITAHLPFERVDLSKRAPKALSAEEDLKNGMLQLLPGDYDTDGFFISALRRKPLNKDKT